MKINFIGLSSFLIENKAGFRILIDPFNDAPEWRLGPRFPKQFNDQLLGANLVLMSEPDGDHSYSPGGWLQSAPPTKPNSNPFPDLNLRGTVVYEWNGDVNIAWHYMIDGIRCAHLADNAHLLSSEQLEELGNPDIVFISAPKAESEAGLEMTRKNLELLRPKAVIWAHHLAPKGLPNPAQTKELRAFFLDYFKTYASTNTDGGRRSTDAFRPEEFMPLCAVLENSWKLNEELGGRLMTDTVMEMTVDELKQLKKPASFLFLSMLATE